MDGHQSKRTKTSKASSSKVSRDAVQRLTNKDDSENTAHISTLKKPERSRDTKKRSRSNNNIREVSSQLTDAESSRSSTRPLLYNAEATTQDKKERTTPLKRNRKKRKAVAERSPSRSREHGDTQGEEAQVSQEIEIVKDEPNAETSSAAQIEALQVENARLQKEITLKDDAMSVQRDTISYIYGQCTCTICLELAWRPHVLSPCGHIFCARCLITWFTKPSPTEVPLPIDFGEQAQEIQRLRTLKRVKVCPNCREEVSVAPVEVWLVKGLLDRVDTSMRQGQGNDEHLVQGNESYEGLSLEAQREAKGVNLPISKAIWKDIFREPLQEEPIFDEEDRVYRCTQCSSEVVNGSCTQCGYRYNMAGLATGSDLLDEEYSLNSLEDMSEGDVDFLDDAILYAHLGEGYSDGVSYGEDDSEGNSDGDGFSIQEMHHPHISYSANNGSRNAVEDGDGDESDDDEDDDVQEVDVAGRVLRRPRYVVSDSEEEDGGGGSHGNIAHITIDGSDEEEEEEEYDDEDEEYNDDEVDERDYDEEAADVAHEYDQDDSDIGSYHDLDDDLDDDDY